MQQTFAFYVSSLRKARGMTQKDLAERLGFTPQGISRFESTDSSFDLRLIDKLCKVLDVSFQELCFKQIEGTHYQEFDLDLDNLSSRLKAYREKSGLTQTSLAESSHITTRSLRSYENGEQLPSFQTLTRIADSLGLSTFELFIAPKEKEEPPVTDIASPKPRKWSSRGNIMMASIIVFLLLGVFLGVGLPVGLSLSSSNGNQAIDNSRNNGSSISPYLPSSIVKQEYPNFLSVDIPKNDFSSLGEEIEFVLYDPDANFSFYDFNDEEISVAVEPASRESSLDIEFQNIGDGKFKATLKNGKTGDMVWINVYVGDRDFSSVTYLRYVDGNSVTPTRGLPFDDGTVSGPSSITLSRQKKASASIFVTEDGSPIQFSGSIAPVDKTFPAMASAYEQEITIEILGNNVEVTFSSPSDIVSDDFYMFIGVDITEGNVRRLFFLKPWKLHLYH